MTVYEEIDKYQLLEKNIRKQFADAKKGNVAEANELETEIAEMKEVNAEMYTMYATRSITRQAYEEHSQELRHKKASLTSIENILADLDRLQLVEIETQVVIPLEKSRNKVNTSNDKIKEELRQSILREKAIYLQAVIDTKTEYERLRKYNSFWERLEVYTGRKKNEYSHLSNDVDTFLSNDYTKKQGADISQEEVRDAYNTGKLPSRLLSDFADYSKRNG